MKLSSQLHAPLYNTSNESEYDLDSACQISSAMSIFKETGGLCQLDLTSDILTNRNKSYITFS